MKQITYALVFEGREGTIFTAGMKTKILQSTPIIQYGTLISMVSPVVQQDIVMLGNSLQIWGKQNPRNEYKQWERTKTERDLKKPKSYYNQL